MRVYIAYEVKDIVCIALKEARSPVGIALWYNPENC